MYGILTFISFLPIFEVSYFRDKLFVHSYEVIQTVTKFAMFKGFNKHNDLLFNPWYDIDPETNKLLTTPTTLRVFCHHSSDSLANNEVTYSSFIT